MMHAWVHVPRCMSRGQRVNLYRVYSLQVYVGSGDRIQISRLVGQASLHFELSLWPLVWDLRPVPRLVWNP